MTRSIFIGFVLLVFGTSVLASAKEIPSHKVLQSKELTSYLKKDIRQQLRKNKNDDVAVMAEYYRQKFSERFFYDYKSVYARFEAYEGNYKMQESHNERALDHMGKYADSTHWELPFNYLNGEEVNAYALRHLARQHKMMDVAYMYFYHQNDPKYLQYWHRQLCSLNDALHNRSYDRIKDGNGVYEAFRSGYRVLNWLSIHNLFLGEEAYTYEMQMQTIATLLQHGAHLFESNAEFKYGNHQTRGMSALAMIAILLNDFEGTDQWFAHAMKLLQEHMQKEINSDGFQFERSVHYHMSDIENYFYVYQLVQRSNIKIDPLWEAQLKSLFTTLSKIAYPDKSAPVLQDDTDDPWAEKNSISGTMTLGYLLFGDPQIGYFAESKVSEKMYWFLNDKQLEGLKAIRKEAPEYGSLAFTETHYYIMRQGWDKDSKMMIVSAGLDADKPDHQHGDMLGIQAMANGEVILPNYQVRYSLTDFDLFKNSMVKNVALVDDELQGKEWTSNKGGSGFGKFKSLPQPKVIAWDSNSQFDLFVGEHNGFQNVGVDYSRQVIYLKNDFWIVKDNFHSEATHTYKQVWQGHYTSEQGPDLLRSSFSNAYGCDIFQLNASDSVYHSGACGKQWNVVSKSDVNTFSFITIIYPYKGYSNRIDENDTKELSGWKIDELPFEVNGVGLKSISKNEQHYMFNVEVLELQASKIEFSCASDIYCQLNGDVLNIQSLSDKEIEVSISKEKKIRLLPGDKVEIDISAL